MSKLTSTQLLETIRAYIKRPEIASNGITTREVAIALGVSISTARRYLDALVRAGELEVVRVTVVRRGDGATVPVAGYRPRKGRKARFDPRSLRLLVALLLIPAPLHAPTAVPLPLPAPAYGYVGPSDSSLIADVARQYRIPEFLFAAIAIVETGWVADHRALTAYGRAGEFGRMQVMPVWRQHIADCAVGDHESQLRCGATILRGCYERTGSWDRAVRCYNSPVVLGRAARYMDRVYRVVGQMFIGGLDR